MVSFEKAWVAYGRKGNKQTALRYWRRLKPADREAIEAAIPKYLIARPEKQYRKDFQGWINPANRMWEDEVEASKPKAGVSVTPSYSNADYDNF